MLRDMLLVTLLAAAILLPTLPPLFWLITGMRHGRQTR